MAQRVHEMEESRGALGFHHCEARALKWDTSSGLTEEDGEELVAVLWQRN